MAMATLTFPFYYPGEVKIILDQISLGVGLSRVQNRVQGPLHLERARLWQLRQLAQLRDQGPQQHHAWH